MGKNTYENLTEAGFNADLPLSARKSVVTRAEHGKKYTLDTPRQELSAAFQVDGYIVQSGRKCDQLVLVKTSAADHPEAWTQIFVELKGHDALHGMDQLLATVANPLFASPSNTVRKARLIATSVPSNKSNPAVEKMKLKFRKLGVDYKSMKPGQTDKL